MLKKGDQAPDFTLQNQAGDTVTLSESAGKKRIVYFYPKDDTPGCTKQAIGFSEKLDDVSDKNTIVYGISKDSVASHQKFVTKYDLKIDLLSDETGAVCEQYGVWQEKKNYGKTYMGIVRTTFVIDEQGVVVNVFEKVRVEGHIDAVCERL